MSHRTKEKSSKKREYNSGKQPNVWELPRAIQEAIDMAEGANRKEFFVDRSLKGIFPEMGINHTKSGFDLADRFGISGKAFKVPEFFNATTYLDENSAIKKIRDLSFFSNKYGEGGGTITGHETNLDFYKIPKHLNKFFGLIPNGSTLDERRGLEYLPDSPIHKANLGLTKHLSNVSKTHTYEPTDQTYVPKSSKGQSVPFDELEQALGTLDLIKNVSEEEIVDFLGHLIRFPMLALEHKVGKLIRKNVRDMSTEVKLSGTCYRCRPRSEGEILPWTEAEMWQAPTGASPQGRFNPTGNGFVYVSRREETAIAEMKQSKGTIIDVMKLNFDERAEVRVIDITRSDVPLFRLCMAKASNTQALKKAYLLPNFLAQCCHIENIHAIKYKSVYHPEVSNYVFFDYLREWFRYVSSATKKVEV